jgi:hypothetical protein
MLLKKNNAFVYVPEKPRTIQRTQNHVCRMGYHHLRKQVAANIPPYRRPLGANPLSVWPHKFLIFLFGCSLRITTLFLFINQSTKNAEKLPYTDEYKCTAYFCTTRINK